MERQLNILRRVDLAEVSDGWDGCYLTYRPLTYGQLKKLNASDTESMSETESVDTLLGLIKENFVRGKVSVIDESDLTSVVDMEVADIDALDPQAINAIFGAMSGAQFSDPKVLNKEAGSDELPPTPDAATETSSSVDSPVQTPKPSEKSSSSGTGSTSTSRT